MRRLQRAFDPVPWSRHAQRREDRASSWRAIECDEVDAGRAAFEQFDALQGGVGDAELRDSLVVIEPDRQLHLEPRRQLGRRELGHPLDARSAEDGHDTRNYWNVNPDISRSRDEIEVVG